MVRVEPQLPSSHDQATLCHHAEQRLAKKTSAWKMATDRLRLLLLLLFGSLALWKWRQQTWLQMGRRIHKGPLSKPSLDRANHFPHEYEEAYKLLTTAGLVVCRRKNDPALVGKDRQWWTMIQDQHHLVVPECPFDYTLPPLPPLPPPPLPSTTLLSRRLRSESHDLDTDDTVTTVTRQEAAVRSRRRLESTTATATTALPPHSTTASSTPPTTFTLVPLLLNLVTVLVCVGLAALAAGLTLGLLGLDPLWVLIKQRAAATPVEQRAATKVWPLLATPSHRHLLLVTLLLVNAAANEALPLCLEQLSLSQTSTVLISVTLVLFFGEIIPSAVFTGPNQLLLAAALVPLVQGLQWLLYPLAKPIAMLLDWLLHSHDDEDDEDNGNNDRNPEASTSSATFTRRELSALIRIQYEERLAQRKRRAVRRQSAAAAATSATLHGDRVGALDFTPTSYGDPSRQLIRSDELQKNLRALKNQAAHGAPLVSAGPLNEPLPPTLPDRRPFASTTDISNERTLSSDNSFYSVPNVDSDLRWSDDAIHADEVTMVEGALQMQTKVALDVFTPMRKVFTIPSTMLLNEGNMVKIYASGYSRIPVHEPGHKTHIVGILVTKLLIVVDPKDARPVSTLPLRRPRCVSPSMPLVNLLNMFQSSGCAHRGGHLALVCARPSSGESALIVPGQALPETAGLMGIITLEDVLEALLQEQIFDEMDRMERKAHQLASKVLRQWIKYSRRKGAGLVIPKSATPALIPVVEQAVEAATHRGNGHMVFVEANIPSDNAIETTALLPLRPLQYS
jgi:metal transporter CNNM